MSIGTTAGPQTLHRARWAVAAAFFTNGAAFASWAPRIPSVQQALELDATTLGLALAGGGIGGLIFTLLSGMVVDRFGSRRALFAAIAALAVCLVLPGLAPVWWGLLLALILLGVVDALMDVAMNAAGALVEQRSGRSLLSGFHAAWSIGAVTGGVLSAAAAALGVAVWLHLLVVGVVLCATALVLGRGLLRHTPPTAPAAPGERTTRVARPTPVLVLLGLLVLAAAFIEDVPQSWSAVYLSTGLDAAPGVAGLAFVAFSVFMAAGRLVGDRLVDRFGPTRVLLAGALLTAVAFGLSLLVASPVAAIAGFALVGLGASPIFPVAFSLAGRLSGASAGGGIALVSLVSRVGFLIAPLLVGVLVDATGFRAALSVVSAAGLIVALLARRLRTEMARTPAVP
ncbi:MFS transporter [Actinoplanes sp. NEAU-A12]|uniref:MFS transporter n=1 Tax=Actinoplanes sandaracinus TaxID=3045177 RepID=A0ABT6WWT0_9ACTN|nr:MFS transporter [Actinoplanes sandaracinus]MDI6104175.1 MFS transporter [Actinoplanes sandaracinus]